MGFGLSHLRRYTWHRRYDIFDRRWIHDIHDEPATWGDCVYFMFLGAAFRWGYLARGLVGGEALLIALSAHAFYNAVLARSPYLPLGMTDSRLFSTTTTVIAWCSYTCRTSLDVPL